MKDAEQILRELLGEIAAEKGLQKYDVAIKPISTGGANYTAKLFLVTMKGDEELNLFVKVGVLLEKMRDWIPYRIFDVERLFYTNLAIEYQEIEEKYNVPIKHRLNFPKFYGYNPNFLEETIVLENLIHQDFVEHNRLVSVDWAYAASAVEEMAKFHALSHAHKREHPEEFEEHVKNLKLTWNLSDKERSMLWDKLKEFAIEATKEENKERVTKFLNEAPTFHWKQFSEPLHATVLVHSDYRTSNLMHKYNDDGTITIKIIDFQTMQGGSPAIDLVYFLITSTDEEFRKKYYEKLTEHYYEQLCAALKRLDMDPGDVYPRKMYDQDLKEKLRLMLQVATFVLPVVTVDPENAPVVGVETNINSFAIEKRSDLYGERLNGIINDCIRWGIL